MNKVPEPASYTAIGDMTVEQSVEENVEYQTQIAVMFGMPGRRIRTLRENALSEWGSTLTAAVLKPVNRLAGLAPQAEGIVDEQAKLVSTCRDSLSLRLREIHDLCLNVSAKKGIPYKPHLFFLPSKLHAIRDLPIGEMTVRDAIGDNIAQQKELALESSHLKKDMTPLIRSTLDDWHLIMAQSILDPIAHIPSAARNEGGILRPSKANRRPTRHELPQFDLSTMRFLVSQTLSGIKTRIEEVDETCADVGLKNGLLYTPNGSTPLEKTLELFRSEATDTKTFS